MNYKILHTCIRVYDLDKSLNFYKDALGFTETRRKETEDGKSTLVFLSDEFQKYEIELNYEHNRKEKYEIGNGFGHIAISVDDLEASRNRHIEMGYEVTELIGSPEPRIYFMKDPDGYTIEILRAE